MDLWRQKFSLRADNVPRFISPTIVDEVYIDAGRKWDYMRTRTFSPQIFLIGKSIDFIRMSCGETVQPSSENFAGLLQGIRLWKYVLVRNCKPIIYVQPEMTLANLPKLEALVDKEYKRTSRRLLKLMYEKYDMATHLRALKSYLLLGQGDFIQLLMDSLRYVE